MENIKGITSFTTWILQIDVTINVICGFQQLITKYLNCPFLIGHTSICKINVVNLIDPTALL